MKSKKKSKDLDDQPLTDQISGRVFDLVFLPWMGILILLHLLAVYVAPAYLWGVDFYHFFPVWIGWLAALISLALLVPGVAEFLYPGLEALAKRISRPFSGWNQNAVFFLLSLLSLPVFWFLRDRLHLLGDGMFRLTDLPNGKVHLQEWLDGFLHVIFHRLMVQVSPSWTPQLTYAVISVVCGAAFVFLALKLSSLLGRSGFAKVLIFSFLITLGSVQLFFGYAESYTILQVALLAYVLLAARYLVGKGGILPVLAVLVISVGLHITSLIYVPSFVYLVWTSRETESGNRKGKKPTRTAPKTVIAAALAAATLLVVFWVVMVAMGLEKTGKGIFIVPLQGTKTYPFSMFSLAHISEFVNQLLLLAPVGVSLLLFFVFFKVKFREFKSRLTSFLILAVSFALVYLFIFNFTLGSADWDLRSSPAVFLTLLGVVAFLEWGEKKFPGKSKISKTKESEPGDVVGSASFDWRRYRAWGLVFIWLGLFHVVPWILINASPSKAVARYVMTQEVDPHPVDESGYNLYKVKRILDWAGFPQQAETLFYKAIERDPTDTVSYYNLAAHYYRREEHLDRATLIADTLTKMAPGYSMANWLMANLLIKTGQPDKALPYLKKASDTMSGDVFFLLQLATAYYRADSLEQAASWASRLVAVDPRSVEGYRLLGMSQTRLGHAESAIEIWRRLLRLEPGDTLAVRKLQQLKAHADE
jgi:hypothetical protein